MRPAPNTAALLVALALTVSAPIARGQEAEERTSSTLGGRFGLVLGGRANLGPLGEDYGSGIAFGFHAGIERKVSDSLWSIGLGLTTLVRGYYFASRPSLVEQRVDVTEVSLGMRLVRRVSLDDRFVFATAGGVLSASNVPIAPSNERRYLGGYGGGGFEMGLWGEWSGVAELRHARYGDGPTNLSVLISLVAGLR